MRRREFLKDTASLVAGPTIGKPPHPSAIRIEQLSHSYQDFHYRARTNSAESRLTASLSSMSNALSACPMDVRPKASAR